MSDVLVLGGGFAGVWSAAAAVRRREEAGVHTNAVSVTLVAPGNDMVIRPRLYEPHPDRMRVPLARVLEPIGVRQVRAVAEDIDVDRQRVTIAFADGSRDELPFGRLIVATGSRLVRPQRMFPGADGFYDVDTLAAAVALDKHLHRLPSLPPREGRYTVVVVGAGFVGIELATELVARLRTIADRSDAAGEVRVVLVERADAVGPELGPRPRPVIEAALDELGIERWLARTVVSYDGETVELSDGSTIAAMTAVWAAGMEASPVAGTVPGAHDELGRLEVDRQLRVIGVDCVFAAGDTASIEAEPGHRVLQACQYAHQLAKPAGHNAVSDLLGLPLVDFSPDPYVTCVDLGAAGAVYTEGFDRVIRATGSAGKAIKQRINRELIYPPLDDAEKILLRADYMTESRPPRPAQLGATAAEGLR
jgi:NADH dehydrogenase